VGQSQDKVLGEPGLEGDIGHKENDQYGLKAPPKDDGKLGRAFSFRDHRCTQSHNEKKRK
jgi:hypothetical protein